MHGPRKQKINVQIQTGVGEFLFKDDYCFCKLSGFFGAVGRLMVTTSTWLVRVFRTPWRPRPRRPDPKALLIFSGVNCRERIDFGK